MVRFKKIFKIFMSCVLSLGLLVGCAGTAVKAEMGDIVVIDFTGYLDGEAFDGGSSTGYYLILGSGTFVDGFEEEIVGHEAGETFEIGVSFSEDYSVEELAGQDTTFEVVLHEIYKSAASDESEEADSVTEDSIEYEIVEEDSYDSEDSAE